MVAVGDASGRFGPEDRASGAEYRCLSTGERHGRPTVSSDWECGFLYPATVFIWGEDGEGEPLPFEEIESFARVLGYTKHKRALLPAGWSKGQWTWDKALRFVPLEWAPSWYGIEGLLKARFPKAEVYGDAGRCFTVSFEAVQDGTVRVL